MKDKHFESIQDVEAARTEQPTKDGHTKENFKMVSGNSKSNLLSVFGVRGFQKE